MELEITDIIDKKILDLIGELGKLSDEELEALANGEVGIA
tara:strand:+ start:334 stop:453 length:120 start_codon:yes stop_codon:yes gene_type:complete